MPWTPPPSLPNLPVASSPVFHHAPNPEVHLVQGYAVVMAAVSEIVVARSPLDWVHLYPWNYLSLDPFHFSLYFPDSLVFHGFPVVGCLPNDQQQGTLRRTEKDLDVGDVPQYFHFRDRFLYPRQYSPMHGFGAMHGAASYPRLGKEQCPPPPS